MKQLLIILVTLVLCYTGLAQGDAPKYSTVSGYGFRYKRHGTDSVQMVPLSTSPHTPYRAGGIRWSVTDSTFEGYTGSQWLKLRPYQINDSAFIFMGDTIIIRGTGGSDLTARNALTKSNDTLYLGGDLTKWTWIKTYSNRSETPAAPNENALVLGNEIVPDSSNYWWLSANNSTTNIYDKSNIYLSRTYTSTANDTVYKNYGGNISATTFTRYDSSYPRYKNPSTPIVLPYGNMSANHILHPPDTSLIQTSPYGHFAAIGADFRIGAARPYRVDIHSQSNISGPYPITVYRGGIDLAHKVANVKRESYGNGYVSYVSDFRNHQLTVNAGSTELGSYVSKIGGFYAYGNLAPFTSSPSKAKTLAVSTADTVFGFWAAPQYTVLNETKNGYGFIAQGTEDDNHFAGRFRLGGSLPLHATVMRRFHNTGTSELTDTVYMSKLLKLGTGTATPTAVTGFNIYADSGLQVGYSYGNRVYASIAQYQTGITAANYSAKRTKGLIVEMDWEYSDPAVDITDKFQRATLSYGNIIADSFINVSSSNGGVGGNEFGLLYRKRTGYTDTTVFQGGATASLASWGLGGLLDMTGSQASGITRLNWAKGYHAALNAKVSWGSWHRLSNAIWLRTGDVQTGGVNSQVDTGYQIYMLPSDSRVFTKYGLYQPGTLDTNYLAGPLRLPSLPIGGGSDSVLVKTANGTVKTVAQSSIGGGVTPSLSATQIAYGSAGNTLTSSINLRYIDSISRFITPSTYANYHLSVGDSTLQRSTTKTGIFYGDSYVAQTTINPSYVGQATQIANLTNVYELNRGIGGTRMVSQSGTDSSMENRIYTIIPYSASIGYIYLYYGTNDATTLAIDTATFRSTYNRVLDSIIINRGYPLNKIYVQSNGYFVNSNPTIQARIQQFATITEDLAIKKGVVSINSYKAMVASGGATLLTSDSVHANERGIEVIVGAAMDKIKGGGTARVNGTLNTNGINVYQFANPVNASLFTGYDTTRRPVVEIRGKYNGTNTESFGVGLNALKSITSGQYNVALGTSALTALTTGTGNVALGSQSLLSNLIGNSNTAIGMQSLRLATGNENTAVGRGSATAVTTGAQNTAMGFEALNTVSTGSLNSAYGYFALHENTSGSNSAFGANSLRNNTSGSNNIGMGFNSLFSNLTGSNNTAVGGRALRANLASGGTAIGYQSLDSNTTGANNTAIGYQSLYRNKDGQLNTAIGYRAGLNVLHGNYNTFIGGYPGDVADSSRNKLVVMATGEGDVAFFGDVETGRVGILTVTPTEALDVNGKIRARTINTQATPDSVAVITDGVIEKSSLAALMAAMNIASGTYTPTLTGTLNVDAVSLIAAHYKRIGDEVDVDIYLSVDPTASGTATNVSITLPFASTMANFTNLTGPASCGEGTNAQVVAVSNIARLAFVSGGTTTTGINLHFAYTITP